MPVTCYQSVAAIFLLCLTQGCVDATGPASNSSAAASSATDSRQQQIAKSSAAGSRLDIASPAPAFRVATWVKGEPVAAYQPGKIYVIEFWATWCKPCRRGMPHLSELQETYGEKVTFIGITDERPEVVQAFLRKPADTGIAAVGQTWNEVVRYRLAVDADGASDSAFMQAAGARGLPTVFVIGVDGIVEWIGHPNALDEPLEAIAAGTWNRDAVLAHRREAAQRDARSKLLTEALSTAVHGEQWDNAFSHLDELEELLPNSPVLRNYRLSILIQMGRTEDANQLLSELAEEANEKAPMLDALAWRIATDEVGDKGLLRTALGVAERACELTGYANATTLNTLARVHAELGDLQQAISWQTRAVQAGPGSAEMEEALQDYTARSKSASPAGDGPDGESADVSSPKIL